MSYWEDNSALLEILLERVAPPGEALKSFDERIPYAEVFEYAEHLASDEGGDGGQLLRILTRYERDTNEPSRVRY
jgi:hypothetical protein